VLDLIVTAPVIHLDPAARRTAEAIGVTAGRVVAVGARAEMRALAGPHTRTLDFPGAVVPGFVDAHVHYFGMGHVRRGLLLERCASIEEVAALVAERARTSPAGAFIVGRGWDHTRFPGEAFPTHAALTAAAPHHPVYLTRVDGHSAWVNRAALAAAGIDASTPDPAGGAIVRDASGAATGLLIDTAMNAVRRLAPRPAGAEIEACLREADAWALRHGVTAIQDAGALGEALDVAADLVATGSLRTRLAFMVDGHDDALVDRWLAAGPRLDPERRRFTVRTVKILSDGALGSRGAALLEPYHDAPETSGLVLYDVDQLEAMGRRCRERGYQLAVHAIGDRAARNVLTAFERLAARDPGFAAARFRLEHAEVIAPEDVALCARLGVVASVQTSHVSSDHRWLAARLGAARAAARVSPWRTFLDAGIRVANGSDAPVEPLDPRRGLWAAMTRRPFDGDGAPLAPREVLTPHEALASYGHWAAYAGFDDDVLGTLLPGFQADFAVLDRDPTVGHPDRVREIKVLATAVGGRLAFET
jgi:predicted amidohydrolase YtcJ